MRIFDTSKREKVEFSPIKVSEASIYLCGPTVYDDAHLGHAKSAVSFDLLRRVLKSAWLQGQICKKLHRHRR